MFHDVGEFVLVSATTSGGKSLLISVKQNIMGETDIQGTGIKAVSVQLGSEKLEVYAGHSDLNIKGSAYLNGDVLGFVNEEVTSEFVYKRSAVDTHLVSLDGEFEVSVTVSGRKLAVQVKAFSTLQDTKGLLGSCDGVSLNDFKMKSGTVLNVTVTGNLNQKQIHEIFGKSWKVDQSNTVFVANKTADITLSGSALCFESTYVLSPVLNTWSPSDFTIDLHFMISSQQTGCGTLFSYRFVQNNVEHVTTVMVCENAEVYFAFDDKLERTYSPTLQAGQWCHMYVVWELSKRQIIVHMYTPPSNIFTVVPITQLPSGVDYNIFYPGGTLMFGQWNAPDMATYGTTWNYYGCIDEVRIWNKRLTNQEVTNSVFKYVGGGSDGIIHNWRFNDGYGDKAKDSVGTEDLALIQEPYRKPTWNTSTTTVDVPADDILHTYTKVRRTSNETLKYCSQFCKTNFDVLITQSQCDVLGNSTLESFQEQCEFNCLMFNDTSKSLSTIWTFGTLCAYVKNVTKNPSETLCNNFNGSYFPDVFGEKCNQRCESGKRSSGDCVCYDGFYGDTCSSVCPASNSMPCGQGICNKVTGVCTCPRNYKPTANCNECADGWFGKTCSYVDTKTPASTFGLCLLMTQTEMKNFEGLAYSLHTLGEFKMAQSTAWTIYVKTFLCGKTGETCVKQVWLHLPSKENITIHAKYPDEDKPVLFINGKEDTDNNELTMQNVYIKRSSNSKFELTANSGDKVWVTAESDFLNVIVKSMKSPSSCSTSGLCGNCDGNKNNDFKTGSVTSIAMSDLTDNGITNDYANYHRIPEGTETGFIYKRTVSKEDPYDPVEEDTDDDNSTATVDPPCTSCKNVTYKEDKKSDKLKGYMIHLNNCTAESSDLLHSFDENKDVTIEIKVKPEVGGVIWSYVVGTSRVSLSNFDATVSFWVGSQEYPCNFRTEPDIWNQLSVLYYRTSGVLKVYNMYSKDNVTAQKFTVGSGLFKPEGVLSLGGQVEVEDLNITLLSEFSGWLDEVKTWSRTFNTQTLLQNYEFDVRGFPYLTGYWNFPVATYQYQTLDYVNNVPMNLPKEDCATWMNSDVDISQPPTEDTDDPYENSESFDNTTKTSNTTGTDNGNNTTSSSGNDTTEGLSEEKKKQIQEECKKVFVDSEIAKLCKDLGMNDYNYMKCLNIANTAAAALQADVLLNAMTTGYMDMCSAMNVTIPTNSTTDLCQDNSTFAGMSLCEENSDCKFGKLQNGVCVCDYGYAGDKCDSACPIGNKLPCGGHGVCNETAQCECEDGFSYDSNCVLCEENYAGSNCDIYIDPNPPPLYVNATCGFFGFGQVFGFRGHIRQHRLTLRRDVYLVKPSKAGDYDIQMRINVCYEMAVCGVAVAIKSPSNDTVIVRAPYTVNQYARVWLNGNPVQGSLMGNGVTLKDMSFVQNSLREYTLKDNKFQMTMKIRIWKLYMNAMLMTNTSYCGHKHSMCSCCEDDKTCRPKSVYWSRVETGDSLFGPIFNNEYQETDKQLGGGYSMKLNKTLVSSLPTSKGWHETFSDNVDTTVQLYFQPDSLQGVLLSYSHDTTFTIFLDTTVKLQCHDKVLDTKYPVDTSGTWYQVVVVYTRANQLMRVYVAKNKGVRRRRKLKVTRTDFFKAGGELNLGMFMPTMNASLSAALDKPFIGQIDDVRVWWTSFTNTEVRKTLVKKNLDLEDSNLKGLFRFNEAEGDYVYNLQTYKKMWAEKYSWTDPGHTWMFSQAPIPLHRYRVKISPFLIPKNNTLWKTARNFCRDLIMKGTLNDECGQFDKKTKWRFIYFCRNQISILAHYNDDLTVEPPIKDFVDPSLMTMLAYGDMCEMKLNRSGWPAKDVCTEYHQQYFPVWRGDQCDIQCRFGYYDSATGNNCTCL